MNREEAKRALQYLCFGIILLTISQDFNFADKNIFEDMIKYLTYLLSKNLGIICIIASSIDIGRDIIKDIIDHYMDRSLLKMEK